MKADFSAPPECVHKTRLTQIVPMLAIEGNHVCGCYELCSINERVALVKRHGVALPVIDDNRLMALGQFVRKHRKTRLVEPLTWDELEADVPKSRLKRVQNARANLVSEGWSNRYCKAKAFIKFEKWEAYEVLSELERPMITKSPRLIQYRSPEYTYQLALFLRSIEKYVFNTDYNGRYLRMHEKEFSKGMTSWEIANNLWRKASRLRQPKFTLLDYSRMDAHLRYLLRKVAEWDVYKRMIKDPFFWWLLDQQIQNSVSTRNRNFWKVVATMLSGEYNTSLGDSEINRNILKFLLQAISHYLLICGDDGVVMTELDAPTENLDFAQFGMVAKVVITTDFSQVEYCQCKPVRICGSWRMVRNPYRIMSRTCYSTKRYVGVGWLKLLSSIGICELSCNNGVPVLQAYADMLYRSGGQQPDMKMVAEIMEHRRDKITAKKLPVTQQARVDFWMSFGIPPARQEELEQLFDETILPCLPYSSSASPQYK